MSDKLAVELRAEAKEMRRRDLLNPDRMFDGLHVAIVAFAQRFEDAAAAIERAERVVEVARTVEERIRNVYVENLHREMLIEEQWPLLDEANLLTEALDAYDTTRADTVRDETLTSAQARGGANEWETFIAADGQPAIRRKRANSADQHVRGLNAEGEKK